MIFSVSKSLLFLSLGITIAVADIPGSKTYLARFDESGLASNSTTNGHAHSLGEFKPVKEGAATASDPAAHGHGHLYTPGMNRPAFAHPTESTPDPTTESKILASRITITETTETISVTNIPLVFKTITITRPYSQSSSATTLLASTMVAAPEISDLPDYRSITIMISQRSTLLPPSETVTGPSQGSLGHVRAAATSQPSPWTGNSTPCDGNESFECVVNGSTIITLGPISQILATGAHQTSGAGTSGSGNHSQNWTSNSAPCAQNKSFECVVEGSSTITLGLISELLGAASGKPTSGVSISSSGNHSPNWTSHSTPCVHNKSSECVNTGSGIITLGPIPSLNYLPPWTADSSPCVQNKSFECLINGSSTITLGLIASLTASQASTLSATTLSTTTLSTNKGMLSTLSGIESLLTSFSTTTSTSSTKLPTVSMTSGTSSWGEIPHSAAPSTMGGPAPCASNTSLECLVYGTSTFVVGTLGLPSQTPTPVSKTLVPCSQNTILSCLAAGSHTLTVPVLPGTVTLDPCAQDTLSSCLVDGSHTLTIPPTPSNPTGSSNFPTASGTQTSHDPYPYPRASNGGMKSNVPRFLVLLCSLLSIVTAQGFHGRSKGADLSITSASINYAPLVSSLNAVAASATGEADGNWGIGAPPATTPTLTPYGGGTATSIATGFTAPQNPTFGPGVGGTTPAAAPTHADSGPGPSSPSAFPSNFIVPVTGSGTEAPVESPTLVTTTSAPPTPSKAATSGSSRVNIPFFLLLLSHLASLAAGTMTSPSPRVLVASVFTSASSSPTSFCSCIESKPTMTFTTETWATTFPQASSLTLPSIGPCSSNTNLDCAVAGTSTYTMETASPPLTTLMTTNPPPTMAGASPSATSKAATSGASNITGASPSATPKPATSGASNIKIPFLLLLFCTLASLISAASASASGLLSLSEASFPWPLSTSGYTITPTKSTTFTITAAQTATPPSSGPNAASTTPSVPSEIPPIVCASNTDLMCIVQGSSTFTVGTLEPETTLQPTSATVAATTGFSTLEPQTTLRPTSATVAATTSIPTPSPSNPAKSGASSTIKFPFPLSFLGTLLSLIKSAAAARDFPIPTDYAGAGNKNVLHQEKTSQGLKSVATPVLVVFLCGAVATVYSLGVGRKKPAVKHGENPGVDSGRAVQREEAVEIVPEGEKVFLFEESCVVGSC